MDGLTMFEQEFRRNRSQWTKAQWRAVACSLASNQLVAPTKRGRPKKSADENPAAISAIANYQALAHEVQQRMSESGSSKIKETVRTLMTESWRSNRENVAGYDKKEGLIESRLEAAYAAVRKILASQRKADK